MPQLSPGHLWVVPPPRSAVPELSPRFAAPEPAARPDIDASALLLSRVLLDQVDLALLACDATGRLLLANRAARRELASARVLQLADQQLRPVHDPGDEFPQLLRDAALAQRSRLQWLGRDEHRLMVSAMPLPTQPGGAMLMLGRRSLCSPLGLEMLAIGHGLTLAERRVMRALVANQSPRQIASDHGVAMSTVRTQIIAIRTKLGVRNIDALMLRAAQVPPVATLVQEADQPPC